MQLTIVGLSVVTISMALALKQATDEIDVMGHDPDATAVARAKRLGAIDKSHWNLPAACEEADLVLMHVGLDELESSLQAISPALEQDAVVFVVSSVPSTLVHASQILPETANLVGLYPVTAAFAFPGYLEPSAQWLDACPVFLGVPPKASAEAVERASTFVSALGAETRFADLAELDGLLAVGEQLPMVLSVALAGQFQGVAGIRDRVSAVGGQLALLGAALEEQDEQIGQAWIANHEALVPVIDAIILELEGIKARIQSDDVSGLGEIVAPAIETASIWTTGTVKEDVTPSMPRPSWLRTLFLGGLGRRGSDKD